MYNVRDFACIRVYMNVCVSCVCVFVCVYHVQEGVVSRAFDIGCVVGRSTF